MGTVAALTAGGAIGASAALTVRHLVGRWPGTGALGQLVRIPHRAPEPNEQSEVTTTARSFAQRSKPA
jgi:hypothetical protein